MVVVRGAGDSFSSGPRPPDAQPRGLDGETSRAAAAGHARPGDGREHRHLAGGLHLAAPARPIIIVAAVRGAAVGAGFQLALACDLRVLADDARFSMREPLLGLVPDLTGTKPLVDLVGYSRALEICATTRWVTADEARDIGLATAVVPSDELDGTRRPTWSAALTAPIYGAVTETKALLQSAARARPRGPAPGRAGGAGAPLPRARLADGRMTRPHAADGEGGEQMSMGSGMGPVWRHMRTDRSIGEQKLDRDTVRRVLRLRAPAPPADRSSSSSSRSSTRPWWSSPRCWSSGSSTTASCKDDTAWSSWLALAMAARRGRRRRRSPLGDGLAVLPDRRGADLRPAHPGLRARAAACRWRSSPAPRPVRWSPGSTTT